MIREANFEERIPILQEYEDFIEEAKSASSLEAAALKQQA